MPSYGRFRNSSQSVGLPHAHRTPLVPHEPTDHAAVEFYAEVPDGEKLGRCDPRRALTDGGFGFVYEGSDPSGQVVAMKLNRKQLNGKFPLGCSKRPAVAYERRCVLHDLGDFESTTKEIANLRVLQHR
jgi:hypothetical protein